MINLPINLLDNLYMELLNKYYYKFPKYNMFSQIIYICKDSIKIERKSLQ